MSLQAQIEKEYRNRQEAEEGKRCANTVLIYSPDLNFSFSLSMALQDLYHVVTTSNAAMLESFASSYTANIAILDAVPTPEISLQIDALKSRHPELRFIMTYVYDARDVTLDKSIRDHVEAVLYKPFEIDAVLDEVHQLLNA